MSDVPKLTRELYWPQGQTALLDAIGKTIKLAESGNHNTTVVILTDGEENFSSTYTKAHVFDLIENKKKTDNWSFIFIGANQDAIKEAGKLGISENSALTFDQEKTLETFECLSNAMSRRVSGETQDIEFTEVDRSSSQRDVHDSASSTTIWPPNGPVF